VGRPKGKAGRSKGKSGTSQRRQTCDGKRCRSCKVSRHHDPRAGGEDGDQAETTSTGVLPGLEQGGQLEKKGRGWFPKGVVTAKVP